MKTLEKASEDEALILIEYLIVGGCDFDLYFHTLGALSIEGRVQMVNSILNARDDIRKEVFSILKKEKEGAE